MIVIETVPFQTYRSKSGNLKLQRHTVVAIAQPGRLWTIFKNMPVMTTTSGTVIFSARKDQFVIGAGCNMVWYNIIKTRPAGFAVELCVGMKQRQVTSGAGKYACPFLVIKTTAKRSFGARFAKNLILN